MRVDRRPPAEPDPSQPPLVILGAYFGYKKEPIEHPVRTNQIPRQIPEQVWYMRPFFSILMVRPSRPVPLSINPHKPARRSP